MPAKMSRVRVYRGRIRDILKKLYKATRTRTVIADDFNSSLQVGETPIHRNRISNLANDSGRFSPAEVRRYCAVIEDEARKAGIEHGPLYREY